MLQTVVNKKQGDVKILLVDDKTEMHEMLEDHLTSRGYRVVSACSGVEALAKIEDEKFHLIITDILMPCMDGIELLKSVKAKDPDAEVILMTGRESAESAISALKFGAFDYLRKPFEVSDFLRVVERALEKTELQALVALYEASQAMFHKQPLNQILDNVLQLIKKVIRADEGSVLFVNPQNKLYIAASCAATAPVNQEVHIAIGERVAGKAAEKHQEYLIINGIDNHPEFKGLTPNRRIQSALVCPMVYQDQLVGVLTLNRIGKSPNFIPSDLRNASIFAAQVAMAVVNGRLDETLEKKIAELGNAYMTLETTKHKLVESEKLASVGLLVSGVAHELNNPLTAVIGYSQLMLTGELPDPVREQLGVVYKEAERCRRIVQDLMTFARARKPSISSFDPSSLLRETTDGFSEQFKAGGILLEMSLPEKAVLIPGDAGQIKQVFVNIVQNACVALKECKGAKRLRITAGVKDNFFEILIEDNGAGIAGGDLRKVFDPFFTTRDVGQGTGLGLSIAYGIIQEHQGTVEVLSRESKGAAFTIRLPLISSAAPEAQPAPRTPEPEKTVIAKHCFDLLVIDDESIIRGFMKMVLEAKGHKVDLASDGLEALQKLKDKPYDLVVCDLRLPKVGGREIYLKIKDSNPKLAARFIFATGSVRAQEEDDTFFKKMGIPVLVKPFTAKELTDIVDSQGRKLYS